MVLALAAAITTAAATAQHSTCTSKGLMRYRLRPSTRYLSCTDSGMPTFTFVRDISKCIAVSPMIPRGRDVGWRGEMEGKVKAKEASRLL
jgi:hypothetical protein